MTSRILLTILIVFGLLKLNSECAAQHVVKGRVTDKGSREALAFVAVVEQGTVNGTYTDIDGYFELNLSDTSSSVIFNYVGYLSQELKWLGQNPWDVQMARMDITLGEVTIRPGVNPAERIINLAIANKPRNNPESDLAFTYDSYNKLFFTLRLDSSISNNEEKLNALDTSSRKAYDFFAGQHLFMMESITKRKFMPPSHSEETIIANRVSGLKQADFALLGTQLQSFSFYGESVNLLDISYLSPLSKSAISKYLFIIEDTTFINQDTIFTISFRPRRGKNFKGMQGQLFINSNLYALQQVIAEPFESEGFGVRIQQQYEWVDGRKWFPKQLNSFIEFPQAMMNGIPMYGEGKSYIKELKLDPPLKRSEFTPVTLMMAAGAANQPDSLWNKYRDHPLDSKELKTYQFVDSIGQEINLDRKLGMLDALTTGQIPMGIFNFDLARLFRYNNYEGWRLGAGIHTNDRLSRHFNIGGFYGYGFRDKQGKYGGDLQVHLYRKRNAWIRALYENEVMELGGNQFQKPGQSVVFTNIYPLFVSRMDSREKVELQINGRLVGNLSVYAFGNSQFVKTFAPYRFTSFSGEGVNLFQQEFRLAETGVVLRYAPGERLARTMRKEVRLGGRFPTFWMRYTRGWKNLLDGDLAYDRWDAMVEKTFRIKLVGDFSVTAVAGLMPGSMPLSLLYNARGSNTLDYNKRWIGIAAPQTFETMQTNEFMHSEFVAVHLRHSFKDLLYKKGKFAPHIVLVQNILFGRMDDKIRHNLDFKTADKGFYESGLQLDNLIRSNFTTLGLGVFYRYGPYNLDKGIENFAFKITSGWIL